MNYLRGAVSAISAPYQYYKELQPINPSTLTGAIDVIVIQRPTDNGDTELACSPFHVRFGKWQVLRPGEKQVTVSVNGHPIPYLMKIGEAGEAFFVFETDEDIPENLITSPILQPTRPDEAEESTRATAPDHATPPPADQDPISQKQAEQALLSAAEHSESEQHGAPQEPDFLDLNALPSPPEEGHPASAGVSPQSQTQNSGTTPKQAFQRPSFLPRSPSQATLRRPFISDTSGQALPSPPPTPKPQPEAYTNEMQLQDTQVDQALRAIQKELSVPGIAYHHNVALDTEDYHSHLRDSSDQTIRGPPRLDVHGEEGRHQVPSHHFLRATSEPPPDSSPSSSSSSSSKLPPLSSTASASLSPVQEYSWEWGAFPRPSPVQTTFGGPWGKGKNKAMTMGINRASANLEGMDIQVPRAHHLAGGEGLVGEMGMNLGGLDHHRSKSVPPELEGSPSRDRKGKDLLPEDDHEGALQFFESPMEDAAFQQPLRENDDDKENELIFGKDGKLAMSKSDPYMFILEIEHRKFSFELSVVPDDALDSSGSDKQGEGMTRSQKFHLLEEVEASRIFGLGKVGYREFLNEEKFVEDESLVVRWGDERYITQDAGSPLMTSLPLWRVSALQERAEGSHTRATSPTPDDDDSEEPTDSTVLSQPPDEHSKDRFAHNRSKSEPPEQMKQVAAAANAGGKTSWVQWLVRSRKTSTNAMTKEQERPELMKASSAPHVADGPKEAIQAGMEEKEIPPAKSAPAYPSTPIQRPVDGAPSIPSSPAPQAREKRYAKALRLTSNQLKALNLKPGANTMTFSLSASGVAAATARIFMWDSTDLVVVSDIDGTITKSDGLGHVFAMIGRDWTHLGVAKLYTDIARNGYKIMYLTSRAIGQADATRDYLKGIKQNDYQLPEGPVIMSPDRLMASLHREVIMRKPEVFKMACLRDIQRLFGEASRNPFYAGFGNRITDALSYRSVDIPSARIFTIDSTGEVKMELLELAGYRSSYIHMTDLVDQMFPPIHRKWAPEYTDLNFWKQPVRDFPLPDLSPPSPALSARSDMSVSTLSRLRNFSLSARASRPGSVRASSPLGGTETTPTRSRRGVGKDGDKDKEGGEGEERSEALKQMSSFERLSSTLGFSSTSTLVSQRRRSTSPGSQSSSSRSGYEDESDEEDGAGSGDDGRGRKVKRERRRSMTSMPGTLDDRHFDFDDDDEPVFWEDEDHSKEHEDGEHGHEEEHNIEDMVDEDVLAAGEIAEVPFLY